MGPVKMPPALKRKYGTGKGNVKPTFDMGLPQKQTRPSAVTKFAPVGPLRKRMPVGKTAKGKTQFNMQLQSAAQNRLANIQKIANKKKR